MTIKIGSVPHGTTIDQIKVPQKLQVRIPIGGQGSSLEFVQQLYGGFGITPSTVTLFTGMPGAGKSTLLLQMAAAIHNTTASDGKNAIVLFNGGEESLYQTKANCERLFYKSPSFFVGEDKLVDHTHSGCHFNQRGPVNKGQKGSILQHARRLIADHPDRHLVLMIDSLQAIDDGKYGDGYTNGQTPLRALKILNDFAKETFASVIVIGQVTKAGDAQGSNKLIHDIDVWLHLSIDTKEASETQGCRIIVTKKNRYGYSGQAFVLTMNDRGLRLEGSFVA